MPNTTDTENSVDELYRAIVNEYETTKSIAQIAKKLKTTQVRVQRVLITEGLWTSKRTKEIAELRDHGLTVDQIAEKLGKDVKTIQTFLPYSRGQYGKSETSDAARSKDYRERMHNAAERMIKVEERNGITYISEFNKEMKPGVDENENLNTNPHSEEEPARISNSNGESVFRLKLELVSPEITGARADFNMNPQERADFLKLAKAKEGICREVLVPGAMNLHAMHYMIQRLFGWQNSHLHRFGLPEEDFNLLTNDGMVGGWKMLCGSLLRFPTEADADLYWDDDYEEGESVKSWFKRKYVGPYKQKCVSETYYDTTNEVIDFTNRFPDITWEMPIKEIHNHVIMEDSLNSLCERLTLGELLTDAVPKTENEKKATYKSWREQLEERMNATELEIEALSESELDRLDEAADGLKRWRANKSAVEQRMYYGSAKQIKEETGRSAKKWLEDAAKYIPMFEKECEKLFTEYNPRLTPLFDTLYYEYDYGDAWCVKISVLDKYDRKTDVDQTQYQYLQGGSEVDPELREVLSFVDVKQRPRCVASDGLYLLDDVGGIHGFHDMLQTLSDYDDPEEKESTRIWARGMGWTGRMSKPENML